MQIAVSRIGFRGSFTDDARSIPWSVVMCRGGVHAASHALANVIPLHILCDRGDIRTECVHPDEQRPRYVWRRRKTLSMMWPKYRGVR
jgi:ATP-dependent helicase YprA (DUF1998 family)